MKKLLLWLLFLGIHYGLAQDLTSGGKYEVVPCAGCNGKKTVYQDQSHGEKVTPQRIDAVTKLSSRLKADSTIFTKSEKKLIRKWEAIVTEAQVPCSACGGVGYLLAIHDPESRESVVKIDLNKLVTNESSTISSSDPYPGNSPPPAPASAASTTSYPGTSPNVPSTDYSNTTSTTSSTTTPAYKPRVAENGSYYGEISEKTGRPKTVYVRGYYRKDGTYVRSHYRSKPRKR